MGPAVARNVVIFMGMGDGFRCPRNDNTKNHPHMLLWSMPKSGVNVLILETNFY